MPIKRKTNNAPTSAKKSKSTTPHYAAKDLGLDAKKLTKLHKSIGELKAATDAMKDHPIKGEVISKARELVLSRQATSFYIDLSDGKSLLMKPNTRRYPLNDTAAEAIERVIEFDDKEKPTGYDISDYYQESQQIKLDADSIHDRLGEDEYATFQADLAEFLAKRKLGDCWEMSSTLTAKPDFYQTSRFGLPLEINQKIEEIQPQVISITAKQEIQNDDD